MSEWRPIETAPKDQTRILTWDPLTKSVQPARWHLERNAWYLDHGMRANEPSHWMPLPEPPK